MSQSQGDFDFASLRSSGTTSTLSSSFRFLWAKRSLTGVGKWKMRKMVKSGGQDRGQVHCNWLGHLPPERVHVPKDTDTLARRDQL